MRSGFYFVDINVWLYRLFDDYRISAAERNRKRNIAISITESTELVISTQVINEISSNLLKKATYSEEKLKELIQALYRRCTII